MKRILLCCLVLALLPFRITAQDKLDKSKKELTEKETSKSNNSRSSSSSSTTSVDFDDEDSSEIVEALAIGFQYTIGGVWLGLVGSYENEDHLYNSLTPYPGAIAEHGNYFNAELIDAPSKNFRIDLKDKFIYNNSNLFGNHLDAKIRPCQYFYIKADYYQMFEFKRSDGSNDWLSLFYLNFAYDRIRFERFNLGWTAGTSYVANGVDKFGFSYGLNAEYFLKKNISFTAAAKWSHINGHPVNAYEGEARFHKKNVFLSLGVEHLKIATPNYNFITLGAGIYF
jgi:hypothetical protein